MAITPSAQNLVNGEAKTMHSATKRTLIAGAGLAAAALFGSLPYHGPSQAQGVPTQHHDVALVDITDTTLLTDEGTFDTALFNDVLGPTGAEEQLFTALGTNAATLLDTNTASPAFSGDFNGSESRLFEGLFLNGLVGEDQVNQSLGATPLESETELLNVFNTDFVPIPASADLTATDLAGAVGTSAFDTDLTSIANADFTVAAGDFEGFLTNLTTDSSGLADLGTLLTDFSSSFSDLSTNLTTDFTAVITDVTSLLGGL
jgi:hypothetical protein